MFHYLIMTAGPREGAQFILADDKPNRIGRGLDCDIILADALSSRVHAIVLCEDDAWWVRDSGSRNGTFVNNQKVDEARLIAGSVLKVGSTEFAFHDSSVDECWRPLTLSDINKGALPVTVRVAFDDLPNSWQPRDPEPDLHPGGAPRRSG